MKKTRSFRGCIPCKIAKRKCNEERPKCEKCVKKSIECKYNFDGLFRSTSIQSSSSEGPIRAPPKTPISGESSKSQGLRSLLSTSGPPDITESLEYVEELAATPPILWRQPQLDQRTTDLVLLSHVRTEMFTSPANTVVSFIELLPHLPTHLINVALSRESSRSSVIATVTILRDMLLQGTPSHLHLTHKTKSLRLLQEDINKGMTDEAMCVSLIAQIKVENCMGNMDAMWKHIIGLHLVFRKVKQEAKVRGGFSPLGVLLRRIIARMDFHAAVMTEEMPRMRTFTIEDEVDDRLRLHDFSEEKRGLSDETMEWILAAFEIDNLWTRAFIFPKQVEGYRRSQDEEAEAKIEFERYVFIQELEAWRLRPVVHKQAQLEGTVYDLSDSSSSYSPFSFLSWPVLYINNRLYAKLLNQWRAINLWVSFICYPKTGQSPESENRLQLGIDICRTHAALGIEGVLGTEWHCLFYAGLVFGDWFPEGREWILGKLHVVSQRYCILGPMFEKIPIVWSMEDVHWNALGRLR